MSNLNGGLSGSGTLRGTLGGGGVPAQDVYWDDILNKPNFAAVATSGSYNDLLDKPIIPPASTIMIGATAQTNGAAGYVPQPQAGDQNKFLNGSGQWVTLPSNGINYSTDEQVVGTWLNGKPIYQKTFNSNISISSGWTQTNLYIPNLDGIIKCEVARNQETGSSAFGAMCVNIDIDRETKRIDIFNLRNVSLDITSITIWYTKSTDIIGG